jgi:hypothetical protein
LGDKGEVIVSFIAKYENRSHDLNFIASQIKLDTFGELSIQAASPENKHYSQFYDAETKEIIRRLYAKDIELFDYEYLDEK